MGILQRVDVVLDKLTDDELADAIGDLGNLIGSRGSALANLRRQHAAMKAERAKRGLERRSVTDHAIVRYLQRHKGVDMDAIRTELRELADEAIPAKDGEHHWCPSGVLMILNEDGGIVTVLGEEQVEKWTGRKLANGERVRTGSAQLRAESAQDQRDESGTSG